MHSRIFEVSKCEPKAGYEIYEADYYEFPIADYVSSDTYLEDDIDLLGDYLGESCRIVDGFKLEIVSKETFFRGRYKNFVDLLQDISKDLTFDSFVDGEMSGGGKLWIALSNLNNIYDNKYGFYINDIDGGGLQTVYHFLRRAKNGEVYNILGSLDYHR